MSQYQPAIAYVLTWEDPRLEYEAVPDVGGYAIAGINSAEWPVEYEVIAAIPQASRGPAISLFYQTNFWNPIQAGGIIDQDLANRVLDESVNTGLEMGPRLLQRAANSCGKVLYVDGDIGPDTLEAVNSLDPERLLAAYRTARLGYYQAVVAKNPSDQKYLGTEENPGAWWRRAVA